MKQIFNSFELFFRGRDARRRWINRAMILLFALTAVVAVFPLFSVFIYVLQKGFSSIDFAFFTEMPKPVGESGGGIANALVGSFILVGMASLIGIPWGIAVGIYLAEYGVGKLAALLRTMIDLLASIPSIVIGLFVYAILVAPFKQFSAFAGSIALSILMVPTIARTTEELLKLVPSHIREAGLALGIPRWKVVIKIVLRGSLGGIVTGIILAIARAAGETAPLLFTALGNRFWSLRLDQPIASLPVQIYTYAISPYEEWHRHAWAAALVLVLFVFILNFFTRLILRRQLMSARGGQE